MFCCIALMVVILGFCFRTIAVLWNAAVARAKQTGDKRQLVSVLLVVVALILAIVHAVVLASIG